MAYNEIFKLKSILDERNIPYEFEQFFDGYILFVEKNGVKICDAVEHRGSYGNKKDLLEIMGALTEKEFSKDGVLGFLTAQDVADRFEYCYRNDTSIYEKDQEISVKNSLH